MSQAPPPPLRVLVVDDNEDALETTALLLRLWGHEVRTARNGVSALALAGDFGPDVVLVDVGMPGMDGNELVRRLRKRAALADVYVLCLTGFAGEADRRSSLEAGCDEHWAKPVDPQRLRQLLASRPRRGGAAGAGG